MKLFVLGALIAVGVLIPVTFVPAQGPGEHAPTLVSREVVPPPTTPIQQVDTIWIEIVADADSVVAVPSSVTVRRGQVVTWTSDLGEWTVKFKSGQPFGDAAVGEGIKGNQGQRTGQAVRASAEPGRYKYDIMVQVRGGPNLRADPEVVIEPGDGPGG